MAQPQKENPFDLLGNPNSNEDTSGAPSLDLTSEKDLFENHRLEHMEFEFEQPFWPWLVAAMIFGVALGVALAMLLASGSLSLSSADVRQFFNFFR